MIFHLGTLMPLAREGSAFRLRLHCSRVGGVHIFSVPEIAGCGTVHTVRLWQRC